MRESPYGTGLSNCRQSTHGRGLWQLPTAVQDPGRSRPDPRAPPRPFPPAGLVSVQAPPTRSLAVKVARTGGYDDFRLTSRKYPSAYWLYFTRSRRNKRPVARSADYRASPRSPDPRSRLQALRLGTPAQQNSCRTRGRRNVTSPHRALRKLRITRLGSLANSARTRRTCGERHLKGPVLPAVRPHKSEDHRRKHRRGTPPRAAKDDHSYASPQRRTTA